MCSLGLSSTEFRGASLSVIVADCLVSLEDFLLDVLAEADGGDAAVVPPKSHAVVGRTRQPLRHQQLHVGGAVGHQQSVRFNLQSRRTEQFDLKEKLTFRMRRTKTASI